MKTNLFIKGKIETFFAPAVLVLSLMSCVSYQSTTQDEDGIYGSSRPKRVYVDNSAQEYKNYFKDLKADNSQIFTDVEKYSTYSDTTKAKNNNEVVEYQTQAHPSWGSNASDVNITIIDNSLGWNNWGWRNPYWGMSYGWGGWNNWGWNAGWGWGGWNSWGWGSPYYGWNSWGWGNPYYSSWGYGWNNNWGYSNAYYANGRRGSGVRDGYYGNNYQGRSAQNQQGRRSAINSDYSSRNVRTATLPNSSRSQSGTRSYDNGTRSYDSGTRNSGTRSYDNNSNSTRTQSTAPTRTYTPSSSPAPTRSSGGSFGGSKSSGGSSGGGGRSSGGGRRG